MGEWVAFLYKLVRKGFIEGTNHAEGAASPVPLRQECVYLVPGTARRLVFLELSECHREL